LSLGSPASSTTKTGRHDIAEILLKVALNNKYQSINQSNLSYLTVHPYVIQLNILLINRVLGFNTAMHIAEWTDEI
jgi:hypothetical protein